MLIREMGHYELGLKIDKPFAVKSADSGVIFSGILYRDQNGPEPGYFLRISDNKRFGPIKPTDEVCEKAYKQPAS